MGAPGVPLSRMTADGSHERTAAMPGMPPLARTMALAACVGLFSFELAAFERVQAPPAKPEMTQNCPGLVAFDAPHIIPAALTSEQVRLTYVGHSTFLIESPQLVRIATDYNDYVRSPVRPDIVTMNHAHTTHFTDYPDPAIKYVLRGWGPTPDQPARHDITVKDVRVRNVPTNIRDWRGGTATRSSSSRWRICASPTSGTCTIRSISSSSTRSAAWTSSSSRWTAI